MSFEMLNKGMLNKAFNSLAKKYRKKCGKGAKAEIILVGGAAIIGRYDFRDMTTDVDALILADSVIQEAANEVGEELNLRNGWLNSDFSHSASYSTKLVQISKFYKTFCNVIDVRVVSGEYLVAMKLKSGRKYKHDLSDILGILLEHQLQGNELKYSDIDRAVNELYGGWEDIPQDSIDLLKSSMEDGDYQSLFSKAQADEQDAKQMLLDFQATNPVFEKKTTINEILEQLKKSKDSTVQ